MNFTSLDIETACFRVGDIVMVSSTGEALEVVAIHGRSTPFRLSGWEDEREAWLRRANEALAVVGGSPGMTVVRR